MRRWSAESSNADDADADGERGRRVPRVIWLIMALHLVLLVLFATLLPTWRAPDEPQHVDLVLHVADTYNYPAWNALRVHRGILNSLRVVRFSEGSKHLLEDEAPPRDSRESFRGARGRRARLDRAVTQSTAAAPAALLRDARGRVARRARRRARRRAHRLRPAGVGVARAQRVVRAPAAARRVGDRHPSGAAAQCRGGGGDDPARDSRAHAHRERGQQRRPPRAAGWAGDAPGAAARGR